MWWALSQSARCLFEGNVPTAEAVTRSQLTKATDRASPYNPVCESIQNGGQGHKMAKHHLNLHYETQSAVWKKSCKDLVLLVIQLCMNAMSWGSSRETGWDFDTGCLDLTPLSTTSWSLSAINTSLWTGVCSLCVDCVLPLVVHHWTGTVGNPGYMLCVTPHLQAIHRKACAQPKPFSCDLLGKLRTTNSSYKAVPVSLNTTLCIGIELTYSIHANRPYDFEFSYVSTQSCWWTYSTVVQKKERWLKKCL